MALMSEYTSRCLAQRYDLTARCLALRSQFTTCYLALRSEHSTHGLAFWLEEAVELPIAAIADAAAAEHASAAAAVAVVAAPAGLARTLAALEDAGAPAGHHAVGTGGLGHVGRCADSVAVELARPRSRRGRCGDEKKKNSEE